MQIRIMKELSQRHECMNTNSDLSDIDNLGAQSRRNVTKYAVKAMGCRVFCLLSTERDRESASTCLVVHDDHPALLHDISISRLEPLAKVLRLLREHF